MKKLKTSRCYLKGQRWLLFSLIFFSNSLLAQICTGSLGDAVVNVNFGTGNNPGAPLPAGTTDYTYSTDPCPVDGSYAIVNGTSGCFGNSWHSLPQDHTPGDLNGYMMLVNASVNPGDFYVGTVSNLCANTTYEFSAWIINVLQNSACGGNGIKPRLTFKIETTTGTLLRSYSTGDIAESGTPTWAQYGFFFSTAINSSIVLRITNDAPGGCGNDLALDDISFRPCGPLVNTTVANSAQTEFSFCQGAGAPVPVTGVLGPGYVAPLFQWQLSIDSGLTYTDIPGALSNSFIANPALPGIYKYRLSVGEAANIGSANCRVSSKPVTIRVEKLPIAIARGNSPVCEQSVANLRGDGGSSYNWIGPAGYNSTEEYPFFTATLSNAGQYRLVVSNAAGCSDTSFYQLVINPKPIAQAGGDAHICEGSSTNLNASGGSVYAWSPARGLSDSAIAAPVASPIDSTRYQVIVSSVDNCTDTAYVTVRVLKKPIANAGPDKVILSGESVQLNGTASGISIQYEWSPAQFLNDPMLIQPIASPAADLVYKLTVRSGVGCGESTDEVSVKVFKDIYIPTAFSPNGDGINDTWRIAALAAFPNATLSLFDRYGQKVFEGNALNTSWDGRFKGEPVSAGTYVYVLDLHTKRPILKGWVIVLQ